MITVMGSYMMRIITVVHMYTRKAPLGRGAFLNIDRLCTYSLLDEVFK